MCKRRPQEVPMQIRFQSLTTSRSCLELGEFHHFNLFLQRVQYQINNPSAHVLIICLFHHLHSLAEYLHLHMSQISKTFCMFCSITSSGRVDLVLCFPISDGCLKINSKSCTIQEEDNGKVSFYTGLPTYEVLEATFNHVSPFVKRRTQSLTLFQEMVMVLMKLRLNVPHQDLAYRFGISLSTVPITLAHWLLVMDVRLSPLIRWPEREELWKTMPQCFNFSFGNKTTVIIDCFEVFCNLQTAWLEHKDSALTSTTIQSRSSLALPLKAASYLCQKPRGDAPQTNILLKIVAC